MTLSIRWKVALGLLVAVVCGFLITGILAIQSLERQYLAQLNEALEAKTKLVAYDLQPLFHSPESIPPPSRLQEIVLDLGNRATARITLITAEGAVIADSAVRHADLQSVENQRLQPEVQQALSSDQGQAVRISPTNGERTMYRAVVLLQPRDAAPLVVRAGLSMVSLDHELAQLQRHLTLALGVAFLVAVSLSFWLSRNLTKPLSDITLAAQQLASHHQTIPVKTAPQDEVSLLAETLNHMADQLYAKIAELSEDRAQLLAVLTSMVEGVLVLDSRSHVLQVNPALERMFGVSRTEARGRPCSELFRHQQLNDLVKSALQTRTNHEDEIVLALSGRSLHVEASVAGGEKDNEACVVFVFHDITELRRLEKIRKDFVANVSHELRTPLTSIKGYVEALLDGGKDDPAVSTKFLDIIMKQSDRLNLLIEDLLELSKIESGRVTLKQEPVDLKVIIDRTFSMIKPIADKKGHRLLSSIESAISNLDGDEDRLVQVLTNLLDNAVKYTPENGTITVTARSFVDYTRNASDAPFIELSVADTGIGIPESDQPRIFERFYRVDKARSRELGGTGLGLAIVKHIIEGHGGQVWVEANHPQGSKFVVRLPTGARGRLATPDRHVSKA